MNKKPLIIITGQPASGKSTLVRNLTLNEPTITVWIESERIVSTINDSILEKLKCNEPSIKNVVIESKFENLKKLLGYLSEGVIFCDKVFIVCTTESQLLKDIPNMEMYDISFLHTQKIANYR